MGKVFEVITNPEFIYILASIIASVIVFEIKKDYKKNKVKKYLTNIIHAIIFNTTLFLVLYPFAEEYNNGITVLWGVVVLCSLNGIKQTEKLFLHIWGLLNKSENKDAISYILKGFSILLKHKQEDDENNDKKNNDTS